MISNDFLLFIEFMIQYPVNLYVCILYFTSLLIKEFTSIFKTSIYIALNVVHILWPQQI